MRRNADAVGGAGPRPLEVGPGQSLATLVRQQAGVKTAILSSLRQPQSSGGEQEQMLRALGQLWLYGEPVDWAAFRAQGQRRRVLLPAYPFERHRHWIERPTEPRPQGSGERSPFDDWFYLPTWKSARP